MSVEYFCDGRKDKLAYVHLKGTSDDLPAIMFLGGFKSDMGGTKALFLQDLCASRGQEFVRFDYSGHGESDGVFAEGTIGAWALDALGIFDHIVKRDVVLVGSSMGGWIALLLLLRRPERICGVVGIAAAPDFTRDIQSRMTQTEHQMMAQEGYIEVPNDYSDDPYIFTQALLEDGEANCLLHEARHICVPLTLIQGKLDQSVAWEKALKIDAMFHGPKTRVVFVEDGDHSLSREQDLELLRQAVLEI